MSVSYAHWQTSWIWMAIVPSFLPLKDQKRKKKKVIEFVAMGDRLE